MKKKISPTAVALTLMTLSIIATIFSYNRSKKNYINNLEKTSSIYIASLKGVLLAEFDGNRANLIKIQTIIDGIMKASSLCYVKIESTDKTFLIELGTAPNKEVETIHLIKDNFYKNSRDNLFSCGRQQQRKNCNMHDRGKRFITTTDEMVLNIMVGIDASLYDNVITDLLLSRSIIATALILIILLGTFFYNQSRHRQKMREELISIKADNRRLEELKLAARGLVHETCNPLGMIRGAAQHTLETEPNLSPSLYRSLENIMQEADVASSRLGDFSSFAGLPQPQMDNCNAKEVIQRICNLLMTDFEVAGVKLVVDCRLSNILADTGMFGQLVSNLLMNALKASDKEDTVSISLEKLAGTASLIVKDTGCGIATELRPDIFKPYVTEFKVGHGLGLAIVSRIVEVSKWQINVDSNVGEGTTFTIKGIKLP